MRRFKVGVFKPGGQIATFLPLYAHEDVEPLDSVGGYSIRVVGSDDIPLAYVCDFSNEATPQLMNKDFVDKHVDFIGEL
jgi:hypothetical protein